MKKKLRKILELNAYKFHVGLRLLVVSQSAFASGDTPMNMPTAKPLFFVGESWYKWKEIDTFKDIFVKPSM